MKPHHLLFTLAITGNVWACSDRDVARVVRRDSASIEIVESTAPRWEANQRWSVNPVPILDLATSGTGAAHEFFRVQDATRLSDGTVIVANRGSGEVRAFSSRGQFQWAVGREGEGPGEFRRLTMVSVFRTDSLVAFDYWLGRVTVIDMAGRIARIISPFSLDVRLRELFVLHDSAFAAAVYSRGSFTDVEEGLYRMKQQVVRLSAETGALMDTIAAYAGFDGFLVPMGDMAPLFRTAGYVAIRGGQVFVGTADSLEYNVYSMAGQLRQIVRVPGYDLTLSDEEVAAERAALLPEDGNAPPGYLDAVAALPSPRTRPAYDDLVVDNDGNVWTAGYHGIVDADEPTDWQVFSVEGEWLGSVGLPSRFTVYEIGADYVLGRWRDDVDVEHVQILALTR